MKRPPHRVKPVKAPPHPELAPGQLRAFCDARPFKFRTTAEVAPLQGTIGQDRAIRALEFGLGIRVAGFNIYVAGPVGTGKNSTVRAYVEQRAAREPRPADWLYVNNFADPDQPVAIRLPAGTGRKFADEIDELIHFCQTSIPRAFESDEYTAQRNKIGAELNDARDRIFNELAARVFSQGFALQRTPAGIAYVPTKDGKPMGQEEYEALPEGEKARIRAEGDVVQGEINQTISQAHRFEKQAKERLEQLDEHVTLSTIGGVVGELRRKYADQPKVQAYLEMLQKDIVENVEDFKGTEKPPTPFLGMELPARGQSMDRYKVNLFIDNAGTKGAPVIFEPNPDYYNLFGGTEYVFRLGAMVTDFRMVKPGAIHRADGGYLVLQARDVLTNVMSWDALKRTIRNREARVMNLAEQFRAVPVATLKPEPIPVDVKVILVGEASLYQLLYAYDEDFPKLFKVKADFDTVMDRERINEEKYAAFVSARCQAENLLQFDPSAVARLVEYGATLAGDQAKISCRFSEISNIVSEASYWAQQAGARHVSCEHVARAIDEKFYRSKMVEDKIQEMIDNGTLLIDTRRAVTGQVNGLAILQSGDYIFGRPSRITARVFVGRSGVVNIERETEMSGRIHSKGVLILSGYLAGTYGARAPLALSCSLTFEQLYDEVDGDSASSTELYAILSALSGLPLDQGIAVTGSVNQRGEIQPIGGVSRKVEGFFDVCTAQGLTGHQGVMIPGQNVRHLMLRDDVVDAVKAHRFHIWAVRTIDEGIAILTGVKAGRARAGSYEPGTVNYFVTQRLAEMAHELKEFGAEEKPRDAAKKLAAPPATPRPRIRKRNRRPRGR